MKYTTCASIAEETPKRMARMTRLALKRSEFAELRLDYLEPALVPDALAAAKKYLKRTVCTIRHKKEGGRFEQSEAERVAIIKLVAEHDPFMLDVELCTLQKNAGLARYLSSSGAGILVSWHDFAGTPATPVLERRLAEMRRFSGNAKIVTAARTMRDAARVLALYGGAGKGSLVAFSMGDAGRMSRILCMHLGSPFTYVSLGRPVAPGQFGLDEIKKLEDLNRNK